MTFNQLSELLRDYKAVLVSLGHVLKEAKGSYREMVGEGINTWADFLSQPEIGLSVREATSLIQLAEYESSTGVPIPDLNLATAKLGASKGILDPALIEDMKVLNLKDFKERHYDVVSGVDNAPRTYTYLVMKRCNETGNLTKVYGEKVVEIESNLAELIIE